MKYLFWLLLVLPAIGFAKDISPSAANLKLKSLKGSDVSIKDFKGKYVLVRFWASWCTPCKRDLPLLNDFYADFQSQGVEVLAVSVDEDSNRAKAYLQQNPVHFPVVFDVKKELPVELQAESLASIYLFDQKGKFIKSVDALPENKQYFADLVSEFIK